MRSRLRLRGHMLSVECPLAQTSGPSHHVHSKKCLSCFAGKFTFLFYHSRMQPAYLMKNLCDSCVMTWSHAYVRAALCRKLQSFLHCASFPLHIDLLLISNTTPQLSTISVHRISPKPSFFCCGTRLDYEGWLKTTGERAGEVRGENPLMLEHREGTWTAVHGVRQSDGGCSGA